MTIYAPIPHPFTCAICRRQWEKRPWDGWSPDIPIPPLCNTCARDWGTAVGGQGDRNRDRRIIRQIYALAAVIEVEAARAQRKEGLLYGRA